MRVIVIGAGPAGLVTAKTLLDGAARFGSEIEVIALEAEAELGGTFRYRAYEHGALVSSKQLTTFSDFRLPLDHPDHLTLPEYVGYLERYAERFDLLRHFRFGCRLVEVKHRTGGGHAVTYERDGRRHTLECDALAICSGLHVEPAVPEIDGIEVIPERLHSAQYKRRDQLTGKRVMVLGSGETGHDIAYEAVQAGAKEVVMCHRDGWLSFPKVLNDFRLFGIDFEGDLPIDGLITNLFETAAVHPWIGHSRLRWHFSDLIIKRVLWLLTGTQAGCDQWIGGLPDDRLGRAYVFLNKSSRAQGYLNKPYKRRSALMNWISSYREAPEIAASDAVIDLAPWPSHVLPSGRVIFKVTDRPESKRMMARKVVPQICIFATGYQHRFPFLDSSYPHSSDCDVRDLVRSDQQDVAFIGFVRPGVGAIPPIAELQAQWWTLLLLKQMQLPTEAGHYHLLQSPTARITHGVDHGAYSSQLARDMGAAPDLWELFRVHGLRILLIYCFGAAFTPFYRLLGPWRSGLAPQIVRTELADTIRRRGLLGNIAMGVIPMLFWAYINLLAVIASTVWHRALSPALELAGHPVQLSFDH